MLVFVKVIWFENVLLVGIDVVIIIIFVFLEFFNNVFGLNVELFFGINEIIFLKLCVCVLVIWIFLLIKIYLVLSFFVIDVLMYVNLILFSLIIIIFFINLFFI